MLFDVTRWVVV